MVYKGLMDCTDAEYDAVWAKIDADGDGNLTVKELATYYGFAWDESGDGVATEMSDEQILEALQVIRRARRVPRALTGPSPCQPRLRERLPRWACAPR